MNRPVPGDLVELDPTLVIRCLYRTAIQFSNNVCGEMKVGDIALLVAADEVQCLGQADGDAVGRENWFLLLNNRTQLGWIVARFVTKLLGDV